MRFTNPVNLHSFSLIPQQGLAVFQCGHFFEVGHEQLSRHPGGSMAAVSEKAKARVKARQAWAAMHVRCTDPTNKRYHRYGGRGIKVCQQWNDFKCFLEDMGLPRPGLQLDRIDNDGDYEPANCRWTTATENMNNRSCSRLYEFNGETLSVTGWARKLGITPLSLVNRLKRMPAYLAFTLPRIPRKASRNRRDSNAQTKVRTCEIPRVIDMLRFGAQKKQVAAWFGVTPTVIRRIEVKHGLA